MNLFKQFESVTSADGCESSAFDPNLLRITDLLLKKTSLERPAVPVSGESRYLTQLWVFGNREPWEELHPSDASLPRSIGFEPRAEKSVTQNHEIKNEIKTALKLLTFREERVLVQFWSPNDVGNGKHELLTTVDQPFGVGTVDEGLFSYRRDSECNSFLVDKHYKEEDCGPPARVYREGLPEWTSDITNYAPEDFRLQESAIRCNLVGYLALPVFDSTRSCVGVLELLMSSKYMSYAYEVQQIHKALKIANLTTPQVFGWPIFIDPSDQKQNRMDKIHSVLKVVCDTHGLPLAQTWAVSPLTSSFVAHETFLVPSCNSFNTKCIEEESSCMFTSGLPFYVRDLGMWHFRDACREQHLNVFYGFVGRAMRTEGLCFCGDVSELSEEEYPLVYNAHISGLRSCVTVFLSSLEHDDYDDWVLEFFLPLDINDHKYVPSLVETLKQTIGVDSGLELGDVSSIQVVNKNSSAHTEVQIIQISSTTEANNLLEAGLSDPESIVANVAKTALVPSQCSSRQNSDATLTESGKKKGLEQGRKRKMDSLTLEAVQQHFGMPIGQAAESLGVSRSTLKRFCREHNISSWPVTRHNKRTAIVTEKEYEHVDGEGDFCRVYDTVSVSDVVIGTPRVAQRIDGEGDFLG
ncbi:hypothetical protein L2E82_50783 [Cichorium intybus]|nr:hypothetical protein L2E82_50783 [Cichorium intybus]